MNEKRGSPKFLFGGVLGEKTRRVHLPGTPAQMHE
jgi:hypothetical protein